MSRYKVKYNSFDFPTMDLNAHFNSDDELINFFLNSKNMIIHKVKKVTND
jgi:hypothetical protein